MHVSSRLITVFLGALLLSSGCARREAPPAAAGRPAAHPVEPQRIVGKWLRPDGGYVLEIRAASADGKLDAGYFNPQPVNISQATWRHSDDLGLVVFVELRDTGYPGATYRIYHRGADDKLVGAYTQPAANETFDVEFVRQQ